MTSAALLNEVETSEYIKFNDLTKGAKYKVRELGTYKSNGYGKERLCLKVVIDDGFLILPERFDSLVNNLKELSTENLYIVYDGREKPGDKGKLKIKFIEITPKKKKQPIQDEDEDVSGEDEEEEEPPKKKSKKPTPKKKQVEDEDVSGEEDEEEEEPSNTNPKKKKQPTSTRKRTNKKK